MVYINLTHAVYWRAPNQSRKGQIFKNMFKKLTVISKSDDGLGCPATQVCKLKILSGVRSDPTLYLLMNMLTALIK